MPALRVCLAVVALALALVAPVAAQHADDMKIGWKLLRDLTDEEVQRQLIAAGSLDAPIGRASREGLGAAIKLFRKAHFAEAYRGKDDLVPLAADERAKLAAALRGLLAEFPGDKGHGLRNAFLRLGAGSAPRKAHDVRTLLEHALRAAIAGR